jgi:methyl-accepting chemotaxis protein
MVTMRKSIADMTADLTNLTTLAASGNLSSRVDPERYQGEFRNIMTQVNHLMRAVIRPIDETIRLSGRYADNVFIDRFDESLHVEGDFVRLKDSLNNVGNQISSTVSRIMTDVKTLNAGALEADANIRSIATGSEEVTQNSRLVDEYAREGEKSVADVLRTVEDFSVAVSDISVKAEQVSGLAADANALSTKGENLARGAENGMAGIKHSAEDLNSMIQTIRNQMKEIGNIVTIITDIADQTNLLALNAAIEAARAGDAGRGFAVVAGEVKDLANQSRLSAENISEMISVLDKQSEDAAQMMEEANLQVNGGIQSVSDTLEVFKEIVVSMDEINRRISDVAASSEEQAASVQEITAIINEVLSGIRQTAVQADKNNRITAEMSAAIAQMVQITESVSKIAESLTEEIDQFKVS